MESLHGGTLLGARGTGFVMFWDRESGEIVGRIGVQAKKCGFLPSLSPVRKIEIRMSAHISDY